MTSQLVKWYKDNKNDNFELVLVSFDRNEKAMLKYLKSKKVNFPAINFKDKKIGAKYASKFIPSFAMVDENGKAVIKGGSNVFSKIKDAVKKQ